MAKPPARTIRLAHGRSLALGGEATVMGVLNVTPDSFSDGGRHDDPRAAIAQAERMIAEGAAIVDIGGESTRPDAEPVSVEEEQQRILPVIEALAGRPEMLLSADTRNADTARRAVAAGAHMINDVTGLSGDPQIAAVAAETGAALVIMHTGRGRAKLRDVIADQFAFLRPALAAARRAGVAEDRLVLDPGFGFAKDEEENLSLLARFEALREFGLPLLVGTSRKRFIGHVTGREPQARGAGTAATSVILRLKGADIFRVHDVAINVDALRLADAMLARDAFDTAGQPKCT